MIATLEKRHGKSLDKTHKSTSRLWGPPDTYAEWAKDINWLWKTMDEPSNTSSDEEGDNGITLSELSEQYQTAKRRYKEQKAREKLPPPFYPQY